MKRIQDYLPVSLKRNLYIYYNFLYDRYKKQQLPKIIKKLKPLKEKNKPRYIVTLTSYGDRLKYILPYAILSMFEGSVKPDKIVLWVAHDDKKNISPLVQRLTEYGLDIRFCDDIRSYKKLIFTLINFPEDILITADDDIYYPKNWLEQLITDYKKNPNKIICHLARHIKKDEQGNYLPYHTWVQRDTSGKYEIFPLNGGGTLFPPHCFDQRISKKELFMQLAPNNDDVWFWAMAKINKEYYGDSNPYIIVSGGRRARFWEIINNFDNLWNENSNGRVDKELHAILEHFGL